VIFMTTKLQAAALAVCAAAMGLASVSALARAPDAAQSRYQSERAVCMHGLSNQDRATCLKEAGAALQEARRGQLPGTDERELEHNRIARCDAQKGADHDECVMRMRAGTTTGSAEAGGILRELSTTGTAQ
jgi:hypothetical protein